MGIQHQRRVYEIPKGFITADERLVLLVMAEQTNDERLEWAHDRAALMPALGLDPESAADHKWLSRRLKDLDDAGLIQRRKQRRSETGTWNRVSIKLEFAAWEMDIYDGVIARPTSRASRPDPRPRNLEGRRQTERDADGRFARTPVDTPEGVVLDTPDGERGHSRGSYHDPRPIHDSTTTVDGVAVAEDFEASRRRALEGLAEFAKTTTEVEP